MARKKKTEQQPEPEQEQPAPVPMNRAIRSGMIKVRAARHLAEVDASGNTQRYAPGDEFETTPERAGALGDLITR